MMNKKQLIDLLSTFPEEYEVTASYWKANSILDVGGVGITNDKIVIIVDDPLTTEKA